MGAFAVVRMPVDLTRRSAAGSVAQDVVETFPGTRNVTLDSGAGTVSFEMQFPGNLSGLIARLKSSLIPVGERADVSLPVHNLVPEILAGDGEKLIRRLEEGPEVWDVAFEPGRYVLEARINGDCVEASIVPSSNSMHELYDALLTLGIVASDGASQPSRGL
jgi:hypothetical protein